MNELMTGWSSNPVGLIDQPNQIDLVKNIINNTNVTLTSKLKKIDTKEFVTFTDLNNNWLWFRSNNNVCIQKFGIPVNVELPILKPFLYDGPTHSLSFCYPGGKNLYILHLTPEWKETINLPNDFAIAAVEHRDFYKIIMDHRASPIENDSSVKSFFILFNKYEPILSS